MSRWPAPARTWLAFLQVQGMEMLIVNIDPLSLRPEILDLSVRRRGGRKYIRHNFRSDLHFPQTLNQLSLEFQPANVVNNWRMRSSKHVRNYGIITRSQGRESLGGNLDHSEKQGQGCQVNQRFLSRQNSLFEEFSWTISREGVCRHRS